MSIVIWKRKPTEAEYMEEWAGEYTNKIEAEAAMQKLINNGFIVRSSIFDINKKPDFIGTMLERIIKDIYHDIN